MLGFCLIGFILGSLTAVILSPIGIIYQFIKVLMLLFGGLCCSKGVREDDDSLFDSMYSKSNYMSLETGQQTHSHNLTQLLETENTVRNAQSKASPSYDRGLN